MTSELVHGNPAVVKAVGEIDLRTAVPFRSAIEQAIDQNSDGLILDLSEVTYMDSAGIAAVIYAYQRLSRRGSRLALVTQDPTVRELIRVVHLETLPGLYICDDIPTAERLVSDGPDQAS